LHFFRTEKKYHTPTVPIGQPRLGKMLQFQTVLGRWYRAGLGLIFPPRCACCRGELPADAELLICTECCRELTGSPNKLCSRCGAIDPGILYETDGCQLCRRNKFHFEKVVALGRYDGLLHWAIARMKEPAGRVLTVALAQLMMLKRGEMLQRLDAHLVVPVPMYWAKRLWRGVNNTELLAEQLAHQLGLPVRRALIRNRNTLPQASLRPRERFANVRGAFTAQTIGAIGGKSVLLVDDVLTTGATCSEAARTLVQAGASRVVVAVIARGQGN